MNLASNFKNLSSGLSKFNLDVERFSSGFFSFVKSRNLTLLNHSLNESLRIGSDVQNDLLVVESRFNDACRVRDLLAHDLLREERAWKSELLKAQKIQDAAIEAFQLEHTEITLLKIGVSAAIQSQNANHSTIDALADHIRRFGKVKSELITAAQRLNMLKDKPQGIIDLANRLREARDYQHNISMRYHATKADFMYNQKHIHQVNKSIEFVSQPPEEVSLWTQLSSPKFWMYTVQAFTPIPRRSSY